MSGALASQTLPLSGTKSKVLDKKSIIPTSATGKFRRRTQGVSGVDDGIESAGDNVKSRPEPQTDVEFCDELLRDGFVQSYVDFYHLTHRQDPNDPSSDKIDVSLEDMKIIKTCLTNAESCRRAGNTVGVYSSYTNLADYYCTKYDFRTSLFFHQKCLDVSQLTADQRAEMEANHALGLVNQKIGDFETARQYHERHEEISISVEVDKETSKANAELYKVYLAIANTFEKNGDMESAMNMHLKCLESSKKCWNKASEGEANGRIGNTLLKLERASESLPYLLRSSEISAELSDANARCRACSALALAYDTLGLADKALDELSLVQTISEQAGDLLLQSQACKAMGSLYSKVGNLSEAVQALQRHFDLLKILDARSANGIGDIGVKDLDIARVYLGISKGNATIGAYVVAIKSNIYALLDWKLSRTELAPTGDDENLPVESTANENNLAVSAKSNDSDNNNDVNKVNGSGNSDRNNEASSKSDINNTDQRNEEEGKDRTQTDSNY